MSILYFERLAITISYCYEYALKTFKIDLAIEFTETLIFFYLH